MVVCLLKAKKTTVSRSRRWLKVINEKSIDIDSFDGLSGQLYVLEKKR